MPTKPAKRREGRKKMFWEGGQFAKRHNHPPPNISSPTPTTLTHAHSVALESLDLYARTILRTLRKTHLEHARIFHKIEQHEPATPRIADLYRALAVDPIGAADHKDYQQCCLAIPVIQQDLRAVFKSLEKKREHVLAVARGVGDFEEKFRGEAAIEGKVYRKLVREGRGGEMVFVVTGLPGEALGERLARVKVLVEDAMARMEMMVLGEGVIVRRFGKLARLALALPSAGTGVLGARANSGALASRKSVEEEIGELLVQLAGILAPGMEEVD